MTFNNNRSFGGPQSFGKRPGGGFRPAFKPGGFNNNNKNTMFSATCATCGNACEVPFKPNGTRPIYCRECFNKNGGDARNDRNEGRSFKRGPDREPRDGNGALNDIKTALSMMNIKLDKLVAAMELGRHTENSAAKHATDEADLTPVSRTEETVGSAEEKPLKKKKAVSKKK